MDKLEAHTLMDKRYDKSKGENVAKKVQKIKQRVGNIED